MDNNNRNFGLDIIRAIAVSLVVFFHSMPILQPLQQLPYGIGWAVGKVMALSQSFGNLGVELFFVLSGVLIGGILIRAFAMGERFSLGFVRDFWFKRWSRTLPNYYLFLGLNVGLGFFFEGARMDWSYLVFGQNFSHPHPAFFPEAWSLSVEEWFYLTLPLVLLAAYQFRGGRPKSRVLVVMLLAYLSFFLLMRVLNAIHPAYASAGLDASIRKVVMFRLDAIAFGVIIAYLNHYHRAFLMRPKVRNAMFATGLVLTVSILVFTYLSTSQRFNFYADPTIKFLLDTVAFSLLPMSIGFLFPAAIARERPWANWPRLARIVTHISLISYSMYLAHYSLIFVPFFEGLKNASIPMAALFYCAYWGLVVGLSTLVFRYYEKPVTAFLRGRLNVKVEDPVGLNSSPDK